MADFENKWDVSAHFFGWNNTWREFVAADSRKKILERRDQKLQEHGDNTTVIHEGPDGSTIRKLNTQGDHDYESDMQGNCIRDHSEDGNVYSFRDKDNVPILSFAMDHQSQSDWPCDDCEGYGYERLLTPNGYGYGEGGDCPTCQGTGNQPGHDGVLRLNSVLRKENDPPKTSEMVALTNMLREHHSPDDSHPKDYAPSADKPFTGLTFNGRSGEGRTWEDIDQAVARSKEMEAKLPKGDVYVKIPEQSLQRDEEGTVRIDRTMGTSAPEWSTENPGPSTSHYVVKTPFTPKRFDIDTGLQDYLEGHRATLPEEPRIDLRADANFPAKAHEIVHEPERPLKIWVATNPHARDNEDLYHPKGMSTKMIEGNAYLEPPDPEGPSEGRVTKFHDVWEINFKDQDEAREFTVGNQYGHDILHIRKEQEGKQKYIPWGRAKLHRPADLFSEDAPYHPLPDMKVGDDGEVTVQVRPPERVHLRTPAYSTRAAHEGYHKSWQDIHDLENSHLDTDKWGYVSGYNDGWKSRPNKQPLTEKDYHASVVISVPNDPRYVERIPQHERRDGNLNAQWRLKPGVKIPRDEYTLEHDRDSLTPQHAYLHIPRHHRSDDVVYSSNGINVGELLSKKGPKAEVPNFKMTLSPNTEQNDHYDPMAPYAKHNADIFKVDLSKIPDWTIHGDNQDYNLGEFKGSEGTVRVMHPKGKSTDNLHIPWDAVVGLHHKADTGQAEEFQKRFGTSWRRVRMVDARSRAAVSGG